MPKSSTDAARDNSKAWETLTWDDLDNWAGARSLARGRSYQREGRVRNLAISEDGRLLASVEGGERYSVLVWLEPASADDEPELESECTCPVGGSGCKHAVAVVAEYLDLLAKGKTVPPARPDDPRWGRLEGEEYEEEDDDEEELDEDEGHENETASRWREPKRPSRADWDAKIRQHIESKAPKTWSSWSAR